MAQNTHIIDSFPPLKRQAIIDAILNGGSLRKVAAMAGCSYSAINRYKLDRILPTLQSPQQTAIDQGIRAASRNNSNASRKHPATPPTNCHVSPPVSPLEPLVSDKSERNDVHKALSASPVRERIQQLWQRTNKYLDKVDADDALLNLAHGLLNQAHKNTELLAKVTGEIGTAAGVAGGVAIQIVMPGITTPSIAQTADEGTIIEVAGAKIGVRTSR